MTALALTAHSRAIAAAAHIVTLSWCFAFFWYHLFAGTGVTWGYAVIDAAVAAVFWRQARKSLFALPLFYVHLADVALYFLTTVFDVKEWWLFAVANRLFEAEIFYVAACALFRIRKLKPKEKGRAAGAPRMINDR